MCGPEENGTAIIKETPEHYPASLFAAAKPLDGHTLSILMSWALMLSKKPLGIILPAKSAME